MRLLPGQRESDVLPSPFLSCGRVCCGIMELYAAGFYVLLAVSTRELPSVSLIKAVSRLFLKPSLELRIFSKQELEGLADDI
jgi:hypothetical protein